MLLKTTSALYVAALFAAFSAVAAEAPLPQMRIEPTTGGSNIFLRNPYTQPLTGYVIELVDYPGSSFAIWQDEITLEPIAPGKEKRIEVSNMTIGAAPDYVKVRAAVYADGATVGIQEKLDQFLARRRFMLDMVNELIRRMDFGKESNASNDAMAANLRKAQEFMLMPPDANRYSQLSLNQTAGRLLFVQMADYLDKHTLDEGLTQAHDWQKRLETSKPAFQ